MALPFSFEKTFFFSAGFTPSEIPAGSDSFDSLITRIWLNCRRNSFDDNALKPFARRIYALLPSIKQHKKLEDPITIFAKMIDSLDNSSPEEAIDLLNLLPASWSALLEQALKIICQSEDATLSSHIHLLSTLLDGQGFCLLENLIAELFAQGFIEQELTPAFSSKILAASKEICYSPQPTLVKANKQTMAQFHQKLAHEFLLQNRYNSKIFELISSIPSELLRLEIAKAFVLKDKKDIAARIQDFRIAATKDRVELATLCAGHHPKSVAEHLWKFNLPAEEMISAVQDLATKTPLIAKHLPSYHIQEEETLYAIALLWAKHPLNEYINHLANFKITDQEKKYALCKVLSSHSGCATAKNFPEIGIDDPHQVKEIATLCCKQDGKTSFYIKNFNIEKEEERFILATLCAENDPFATAANIIKFELTDPNYRFAIAKICAGSSPSSIQYFHHFNILEEKQRFYLAKLYAASPGDSDIVFNLEKLQLNDLDHRQKIALRIAEKSSAIGLWSNWLKGSSSSFLQTLTETFLFSPKGVQFKDLYLYLPGKDLAPIDIHKAKMHTAISALFYSRDDIDAHKFLTEDLLPNYKSHVDTEGLLAEFLCEEPLENLSDNEKVSLALALYMHEKCGSTLMQGPIKKAFKEAIEYRNPSTAFALTKWLIQITLVSSITATQVFEDLIESKSYLKLALAPLFAWLCMEKETEEEGLTYIKDIAIFLSTLKETIKDKNSGLLQMIFFTCEILNSLPVSEDDISLSAIEKIKLLWTITRDPSSSLFFKLIALQHLYEEQKVHLLRQIPLNGSAEFLQAHFVASIKEAFSPSSSENDSGSIDDFTHKYAATLGSCRVPLAWKTYRHSIQQSIASSRYQEVLASIFESRFEEHRIHATRECSHAKNLMTLDADCWGRWELMQHREIHSKEEDTVRLSFKEEIESFFASDPSLAQTYLGCLPTFFSASKKMKDKMLAQYKTTLTTSPSKENLMLYTLMRMHHQRLHAKDAHELIKELQSAMQEPSEDAAFLALKNLITNLTSQIQASTSVEVVLSHDWQDLLLSGTEISGSCQRVDGSCKQNICLLAYLLDAKIKIIAVKEFLSQKIQARSILRLLVDSCTNQPALFIDRPYPADVKKEEIEQILSMAVHVAKDLSVPLFSSLDFAAHLPYDLEVYAYSLLSLEGPAPYEYVDAIGGKHFEGYYQIDSCKKIV